jgi:ABC-type polysaccharide/polyol phosphate transport system ATPase subunit
MSLPFIKLDRVTIEYPVYSADSRSLKRSLLNLSSAGRLGLGVDQRVVVRALNDISLDLTHGDRVGLIGVNGAGKTSLLRALAGVYEPIQGSIEINGRVISLFNLTLGMDAEATGYENILIRGLILGLTQGQISAKRREIMDFTELGAFLDMPLRTYSSGMMLRLAFAISTSIVPDILLLDEWIGVGDAGFLRKAEERARALVSEVGILVVASHQIPLLEHVCNRIVWLDGGTVRDDGPTKQVLADYSRFSAG